MAASRLDMIGLVCKDMAASVRFYRLLGLAFDEPGNEPYLETALDGGVRVSLNHVDMVKSIEPDWEEPSGQRVGLAFLCDSPASVDAKYAELTGMGHPGHKAPWDAFWGQRYAQVSDPDGNVIDLFAPLAV